MEGKTAAEKAAEDATAEQDAPSWVESVGAGAAWSAVANIVGGAGGGGHGHSHGPSISARFCLPRNLRGYGEEDCL
jgi:hypothetical protein